MTAKTDEPTTEPKAARGEGAPGRTSEGCPPNARGEPAEDEADEQPYERPALVYLGSVAELTRSGGGPAPDGLGFGAVPS